MEGPWWIWENLFEIISAVGVIGGLFFTAYTIREETKARKISNLLAMTESHRDVWQDYLSHPNLWRVTDPAANLDRRPVRPDEEVFVKRVILHLSSMYEALKEELVVKQEGLRRDAEGFFSLPIPQAVWETMKLVQNRDFVSFVEECRRGGRRSQNPRTNHHRVGKRRLPRRSSCDLAKIGLCLDLRVKRGGD